MKKYISILKLIVIFAICIYGEISFADHILPLFSLELQGKLSNAIMLHIGHSKAFINSKETDIDSNNASVYPFIKDGRTLVPVRFISENIGAKVEWDDSSKEVQIKVADKNIKLKIGWKKIYINNAEKEIDVPAQIINERTFIPLRAVVEAIGKKVFWNDRGIIVISDINNLFDTVKDEELLDEVEKTFSSINIEYEFSKNESIGFLKRGMIDKEVIGKLGYPDKKSEIKISEIDGEVHTWTFINKGVQLDIQKDEINNQYVVHSITITAPSDYKTSKNIGIGSTKDEVFSAYKYFINKVEEDMLCLGNDYDELVIKFKNNKIYSISLEVHNN